MSSFTPRGELDMSTARIIDCFGKKNSGKSVMGLLYAYTFPGDLIVIDVAGDDGPMGPGVIDLAGTVETLPQRFPEERRRDKERLIVRYCPDAGSPTYLEDIDAVVGMAYAHSSKERPAMLLIHEIGRVAPANQTRAHMRRVLDHNRHRGLFVVMCGPRTKTIDPLVLGQADLVYVFKLSNALDRARLAETIDYPADELDEGISRVRGHSYLRYDANEDEPEPAPAGVDPDSWDLDHPDYRLVAFPPLPREDVARLKAWAMAVPRQPGPDEVRPSLAVPGTPTPATR